jgi:hypothetical protein
MRTYKSVVSGKRRYVPTRIGAAIRTGATSIHQVARS